MSNELSVIPSTLDVLERELTSSELEVDTLYLHLRALQRMGLSRGDLVVHVERIRAKNDATVEDEDVEDNALLALDLIEGLVPHHSLRWDAAEVAKLLLPKVLNRESLRLSISTALAPSNMLPPRAENKLAAEVAEQVCNTLWRRTVDFEAEPQPADFYRVPKAGMTTRPAALLSAQDKLIYESLADAISYQLDRKLPDSVTWPRGRNDTTPHLEFSATPLRWNQAYVVVTDIDSFYECVDHTLLASVVDVHLEAESRYPEAIEAFLNAVMRSTAGLPQGPAASDIFASAYLFAVDTKMTAERWTYTRYADDYVIAADSVVDGRRKLEALESSLYDLGLRLNAAKTKVMRREVYLRSVEGISPRVERLRNSIKSLTERRLRESEEPEEIEAILTGIGADEQILFDLLYHRSSTLDEVLDEVRDLLRPSVVDAYAQYFERTARRLRRHNLPNNMLDTEKDLRECLTFLASAAKPIDLGAVDQAFKWFPRLAPNVAAYLKGVASGDAGRVADFLTTWITRRAGSDWVTAWMCNVVEVHPLLGGKGMASTLRYVGRNRDYGLLTRSAAVRALAASGSLDSATWENVISDSTPAIRSELALSRMANPELYPEGIPAIDSAGSLGYL